MEVRKNWSKEGAALLIESRLNLALTQEELAERAVIDVRVIKKAEAGQNIALKSIRQIAKAIGMESAVLRRGKPAHLDVSASGSPPAELILAPRTPGGGDRVQREWPPTEGAGAATATLLGEWDDTYQYVDGPGRGSEHQEVVRFERQHGERVAGSIFEADFPDRVWRFEGIFERDLLLLTYRPPEGALWMGHGCYALELRAAGHFEGRSIGFDFHLDGKGTLAKHRMVRHT